MSGVRQRVKSHRRVWAQFYLSLAGGAISAYLAFTKWTGQPPVCGGYRGCDVVNASPYAEIFGIPVAALGLGMYAAIALLTIVTMGREGTANSHADLSRSDRHLAVVGLSFTGVIFSGYLTYLELFVIRAICLWCVASALIITAIFILSLFPTAAGQAAAS